MAYNFPYLKDSAFLKKFDKLKLKEQFVKIVVLNFKEIPIQEIQGKVTGGSFTFDGSSAMRRTANISFVLDDVINDFTTTQNLLSINKKIEVLVGFTNTTGEYTNYDKIWFPMGVYVIINVNISHNSGGITASLTLHDKMALLNGQCGGVFPASVILNEVQDMDEDGNIVIIQPTIYQIIQQVVNHFGGQQLGKIIITDVDDKIKQVMKWTGSTPLYLYQQTDDGTEYSHFDTNWNVVNEMHQQYGGPIQTFEYGEDIGYILTKFVYPTDLITNAGDTIVSVLDQIKNTLGNYEYFYDVHGNFRFQQIKNYLNTSYSTFVINEMTADNYLVDYTNGKSVYTFDDGEMIISYSNTPQYQQIKNDFMVWGKRTTISGQQLPIRYHLAIDKKPEVGNEYQVFFVRDPDDGLLKAKKPLKYNEYSDLPIKGEIGMYYYVREEDRIYEWNNEIHNFKPTAYTLETVTTNDFRTQLYMAGVASEPFGLDSNYYYTELQNEWPKLYNMRGTAPKFKDEVISQPSEIDYFLDFIDTSAALSEFSVDNIGRRTTVINDDSINCIFEPDNPNIVIIQSGSPTVDELEEECQARGQEYILVSTAIYDMLHPGGILRSAYEQIRKELYQYTSYNEQISLSMLPIYYLEPNTRITVRDPQIGIYGDYMIKSISLPLDTTGTMTLSCTRALERI